jgi:hypothetical protein
MNTRAFYLKDYMNVDAGENLDEREHDEEDGDSKSEQETDSYRTDEILHRLNVREARQFVRQGEEANRRWGKGNKPIAPMELDEETEREFAPLPDSPRGDGKHPSSSSSSSSSSNSLSSGFGFGRASAPLGDPIEAEGKECDHLHKPANRQRKLTVMVQRLFRAMLIGNLNLVKKQLHSGACEWMKEILDEAEVLARKVEQKYSAAQRPRNVIEPDSESGICGDEGLFGFFEGNKRDVELNVADMPDLQLTMDSGNDFHSLSWDRNRRDGSVSRESGQVRKEHESFHTSVFHEASVRENSWHVSDSFDPGLLSVPGARHSA